MNKDIIIYIISVAISIVFFYIITKKKCNLLKIKKEELKSKNETSDNLTFIFYQMLGDR